MSNTALITSQNAAAEASPRRCQLLVIEGPDAGRAVGLGENSVRVGTREGCGLRLTAPRVSAEHLEVRVHPQGAGPELTPRTDLPFAEAKQTVIDHFERHYLRDVLTRSGGNLSEAARQAGVDRKHFRTLARRHGLLPAMEEQENEEH